ncbi:MAG: hypothetical protein FWH03_05930 [Firmicutes bacterium]|nr:hypothetical protein [Bacillota bacterium]
MKKPICNNCYHYTAYYNQRSFDYVRMKHGACSKHKVPKRDSETCEHFKCNQQKMQIREEARLRHLDDALVSINDIAKILREQYANLQED